MQIDIVFLGLLIGGDFYGYEIMKIVKSVMTDITAVTTGTVYYKLKNLEKKGFLASMREQEGQRPPRLRYAITAAGRKEFRRLALANLRGESRPYWPILSSLFFVQHLPPAATTAALRQKVRRHRDTLARLEKIRKVITAQSHPFHALMILEHGMRHLRVDIAWLEQFARRLAAGAESLRGHPSTRHVWEEYLRAAPLSKDDAS